MAKKKRIPATEKASIPDMSGPVSKPNELITVPQTKKIRTAVPDDIRNTKQARKFLRELYENGESFHPEDAPDSIGNSDGEHWYPLFTEEDAKRVEVAMDKIAALPNFDACKYLLELDEEKLTSYEHE